MPSPSVLIVGAGPIGIELAAALGAKRIACRVIEAGSLGQTISWWAPQTRWFSSNQRIAIAGMPLTTIDGGKSTREQYLKYLRDVVQQFEIDVQTHTTVESAAKRSDGRFEVKLNCVGGESSIVADAVVLAIGGTDRPKRLDVPGENLPHVDGYLREIHRYFGRRVMVIGGRNSAIEAALRLYHAGAHVTLSYRGSSLPEDHIKYWLLPEISGLIRAGEIQCEFETEPVEILPNKVILARGDQTIAADVDDILCLIGYEQDKSLFNACGVELTGEMERPVVDEETMQSSVPGLYVAGTAVAGTQSSRYKTFLENCHVHVRRIVDHLSTTMCDPANLADCDRLETKGVDEANDLSARPSGESSHRRQRSARESFEKLIEFQPES